MFRLNHGSFVAVFSMLFGTAVSAGNYELADAGPGENVSWKPAAILELTRDEMTGSLSLIEEEGELQTMLAGDTFTLAPLVQDSGSAFYISDAAAPTQHTFDGLAESGGGSLLGTAGATFEVLESTVDLGGGAERIIVQVTAVDVADQPEPWVDAAHAGAGYTAWRLDIGSDAGGANPIEPDTGFSVSSSGVNVFDSSGASLGTFDLTIDSSDSSGVSGVAVISLGGADIAGFDLSSLQMYWEVVYGGTPDVAVQQVDASDGAYAPGDDLAVRVVTENVGTANSSDRLLRVYASTDEVITDSDSLLDTFVVPALGPGEVLDAIAPTSIPPSLPHGEFYIGTIIDAGDDNPSNDVGHDPVPIFVTSDPDIDVRPSAITIEGGSASAAVASTTYLDSRTSVPRAKEDVIDELLPLAQLHGTIDVIVGLDSPFEPEGRLSAPNQQSQRAAIRADQDDLLTSLQGWNAQEKRRFRSIPYMALRVDAHALPALENNPRVVSISRDHLAAPTMDSSNPVIGAPLAWADGWDGTGQAVAVLDTGVDSTHPWLTGKVVSEACYSTNNPGVTESLCPGGATSSVDAGSGANCVGIDGCDHGTHVAGTVAGNDGVGPGFGVARGAGLIAVQVFSRFVTSASCNGSPPCLRTYSSDQIAALERVLELSGSMDVAAVNMSLGGGQYFDQATCDADNLAIKTAIDNLLSVGIVTAIASGNDGFKTSTGTPGCVSSAVTVGATTDADQVASFSNIATFIDLLAPGVDITSSVPGGGTASFQGTSMATPHVAGAFVVLRGLAPAAQPGDLLNALANTGTPVDDTRAGGSISSMPRINIDLALGELGNLPKSFAITNSGPGTLEISSIAPDQAAAWLSFSPTTPFDVPDGQMQVVDVLVDFDSAPPGTTLLGINIESNDPDESPWPGGVALTVINNGTNTPPVADPQSLEVIEDDTLPVTLTGSDADTDPLTFNVTVPPVHGVLNPVGGNANGGQWTYVPSSDYYGADSFSFVANDGKADSSPEVISIDVLGQNDPPSFDTQGNETWPAGETGEKSTQGWITNLSLGPTNESGQALIGFQVNVTSDPDAVLAAIDVLMDGTLQYTLTGNTGQAEFGVTAQDDGGTAYGGADSSSTHTAMIEVLPEAVASLSGVVVDTSDGVTPVHPVFIDLLDPETGLAIDGFGTDNNPDGSYEITGITPGSYKVFFNAYETASAYADELFNGIVCDNGSCGLDVMGDVLVITGGANVLDVDLERRLTLSGRVTDINGFPFANIAVDVLDGSGELVESAAFTNANGEWVKNLPGPGTYYVRTVGDWTPNHIPEIWDDHQCNDCYTDPVSIGDPIEVIDSNVGGIDFQLDPVNDGKIFIDNFE